MSHTINDLRAALFAQLDNLRNPARDVDQEVNRARNHGREPHDS